jgi:general secretion pathway protein J
MRNRSRGFTLLEILVAIAILAIMSVMAFRSVSEARVSVENAGGHMDRLREVQRAMNLLTGDFRTLAPRPIREPIGDGYRAALRRDPNGVGLVELSHAGWPNGAGSPRGTVQRVSYRLEEQTLIREYWNVTDPTLANVPIARRLLKQVESIEIRYMSSGREWVTEWPPLDSAADTGFRARPMAVEITIVLTDYGKLRRLIEVSG